MGAKDGVKVFNLSPTDHPLELGTKEQAQLKEEFSRKFKNLFLESGEVSHS